MSFKWLHFHWFSVLLFYGDDWRLGAHIYDSDGENHLVTLYSFDTT